MTKLDVFHWKMSAAAHKSAVDSLRGDIIHSHANGTPLPIQLIADLLPLESDQLEEAAKRGNFKWTGSKFSNEAPDELWMELEDPVMQTFTATIPAVWSGEVKVAGKELTIRFDTPIELEIPRLATLGVGRSQFQSLTSIVIDSELSLSVFEEVNAPTRQTWVEAKLSAGSNDMQFDQAELEVYAKFEPGDGCGFGDPEDPNWYVYSRVRDGICVVHYGTIIAGGSIAYEYRYGPGTKAQADAYFNQHC